MTRSRHLTLSALALVAAACTAATSSGTSDDGDECGVAGSKTLDAVTDAEKATLCDCTNRIEGGYGATVPCEGGVRVSNKKDRAACVAAWRSCASATVADGVACAHAVAEHDRCDFGGDLADPRCAYVKGCLK